MAVRIVGISKLIVASRNEMAGHAGKMTPELTTYPGYRFHAVWLYQSLLSNYLACVCLASRRSITCAMKA
jgi:hypothetical protein